MLRKTVILLPQMSQKPYPLSCFAAIFVENPGLFGIQAVLVSSGFPLSCSVIPQEVSPPARPILLFPS